MATSLSAVDILDREFLQIRTRLIDIAAAFDRIDRGHSVEAVRGEPRLKQIREAVAIVSECQADRTLRIQQLFSDAYDEEWRKA